MPVQEEHLFLTRSDAGMMIPILMLPRSDAGSTKLTVTFNIPFSKRYLKYLTKKFLKNSLRDWIQ